MEKSKKLANRIPVTILTGFLGSGKTTLLNFILTQNHGRKIAVIENEFGEIGIDDKLVNKKFFSGEELIEMKNGCICCTVRGDLINILNNLILKKEKFDYVIIETTGLADPAPVAQTFFVDTKVQKHYYLDAIITLVDAKHFEQHLDDQKEEGVENEAREQIAFADRILLNKVDLVDKDYLLNVKKRIKSINDKVQIFETQNSVINLDNIINIKAFDIEAILRDEPAFLENNDHQHDQSVSSCGFQFEGELNKFRLDMMINQMIDNMGKDMFRYKGIYYIKGENKKYVFQGIHMLFMSSVLEDIQEGEKKENKFIFIGRRLRSDIIEQGLKDCLVTKDLRFKVGDRVDCKTGKNSYEEGTIIKLWDDGNSYRIRLDDGEDVWAPDDTDDFLEKIE